MTSLDNDTELPDNCLLVDEVFKISYEDHALAMLRRTLQPGAPKYKSRLVPSLRYEIKDK